MFFLFFAPDTYTTVNISRLSRLEKEKNSQKAFTSSEREGARAWASATTAHTSGEECQQVFFFFYIIIPCWLEASPKWLLSLSLSLSLSVALLNAKVITTHTHIQRPYGRVWVEFGALQCSRTGMQEVLRLFQFFCLNSFLITVVLRWKTWKGKM